MGASCTGTFRTAAANGPAPPQPQQVSGAVTVQVDSGQTLFVDPIWNDGGKGQCRVVANKTALPLVVPLGDRSEWQSFRDPLPWPTGPHAGATSPNHFQDASATQTVCCRPQGVTLCQGAPGGTVSMGLPYSAEGDSRTLTATCVDQWSKTYSDSQTWQCGHTGSGAAADGQWNQVGGDAYVCSPNAFTSACSATCGGGGSTATGSQTTFDSCGNVQSVKSCSISCCTPNYQKVGCNTSTAIMQDVNNCPGSTSYTVSGGCRATEVGENTCSPFWVDCNGAQGWGCGNTPDVIINGCDYGPSTWYTVGDVSNCNAGTETIPFEAYIGYVCYRWQ